MKFIAVTLFLYTIISNATPPPLQLANTYSNHVDIKNYWVSEKLDGVRAYWNGSNFISRQGNIIRAPHWFIEPLPITPLDGELWIGRGQFEKVSGIIRQQTINEDNWKNIKYMIFDLPGSPAIFDLRLQQLEIIIKKINAEHIRLIKQIKVSSAESLSKKLEEIVAKNAEGLMLHSGTSFYKNQRNNDLLKFKKYADAEAIVIQHYPGKGKFTGMMGAILVEMPDKKRFKIGTGFSNDERKNPPPINSVITYKYFGLTSKGTPRFASFMRMRNTHYPPHPNPLPGGEGVNGTAK